MSHSLWTSTVVLCFGISPLFSLSIHFSSLSLTHFFTLSLCLTYPSSPSPSPSLPLSLSLFPPSLSLFPSPFHSPSLSCQTPCSNGYYIPGASGISVSVGVASQNSAHSQSGSITKVLGLLTKQMQLFTLSFDTW